MGQVIGFLLIAAMAIYAIKLAFLFLILAGLIFRTGPTIGLLAAGAIWMLFWKAPVIGSILIGLAVLVAIYKAATKTPTAEQTPRLTDDSSP